MKEFDYNAHAAENGGFTQVDFGYIMARLTDKLEENWDEGCVVWGGSDGSIYIAWPKPEPDRLRIFSEWNIFRRGPIFPDRSAAADFFELRYDREEDVASMNHTGHELTSEMFELGEFARRIREDNALQTQLGMNRPMQEDGDLLASVFDALFADPSAPQGV